MKIFKAKIDFFLFLVSLTAVMPAYGAGVWTNEPAGSAVMVDCPFSGPLSTCGIKDTYSSSIQDSDSSAPVSPSGVLRSTLKAGNADGGMQIGWSSPQLVREMYVGIMWRTNPGYQCLQLADKMWFVRGPNANGFFGIDCTTGDTSAPIGFGHNTGGLDNSHTCAADLGLVCYPNVNNMRIQLGTWTKLESYIKTSTTATSRDGIVRWWINGVLVGNYTNMNYGQGGLNEWIWTETWGAIPPQFRSNVDLSHYLDHLRISIPNCSSGCSPTGGTPPSPSVIKPPVNLRFI